MRYIILISYWFANWRIFSSILCVIVIATYFWLGVGGLPDEMECIRVWRRGQYQVHCTLSKVKFVICESHKRYGWDWTIKQNLRDIANVMSSAVILLRCIKSEDIFMFPRVHSFGPILKCCGSGSWFACLFRIRLRIRTGSKKFVSWSGSNPKFEICLKI